MLRSKGSRGWFGPRVLWMCIGTAAGLLAPHWGLILTPIMLGALLVMATFTDRLEWINMLQYMNLLKASAGPRTEEVDDAGPQK